MSLKTIFKARSFICILYALLLVTGACSSREGHDSQSPEMESINTNLDTPRSSLDCGWLLYTKPEQAHTLFAQSLIDESEIKISTSVDYHLQGFSPDCSAIILDYYNNYGALTSSTVYDLKSESKQVMYIEKIVKNGILYRPFINDYTSNKNQLWFMDLNTKKSRLVVDENLGGPCSLSSCIQSFSKDGSLYAYLKSDGIYVVDTQTPNSKPDKVSFEGLKNIVHIHPFRTSTYDGKLKFRVLIITAVDESLSNTYYRTNAHIAEYDENDNLTIKKIYDELISYPGFGSTLFDNNLLIEVASQWRDNTDKVHSSQSLLIFNTDSWSLINKKLDLKDSSISLSQTTMLTPNKLLIPRLGAYNIAEFDILNLATLSSSTFEGQSKGTYRFIKYDQSQGNLFYWMIVPKQGGSSLETNCDFKRTNVNTLITESIGQLQNCPERFNSGKYDGSLENVANKLTFIDANKRIIYFLKNDDANGVGNEAIMALSLDTLKTQKISSISHSDIPGEVIIGFKFLGLRFAANESKLYIQQIVNKLGGPIPKIRSLNIQTGIVTTEVDDAIAIPSRMPTY